MTHGSAIELVLTSQRRVAERVSRVPRRSPRRGSTSFVGAGAARLLAPLLVVIARRDPDRLARAPRSSASAASDATAGRSSVQQVPHDARRRRRGAPPHYVARADSRLRPGGAAGSEAGGSTSSPSTTASRASARFLRRWSLDELPQLWNVLRGEMSLVGPRPVIPYEAGVPIPSWYRERFAVKPGMTGLWQVSGRNERTYEEMVRLDIEYVRRQSLAARPLDPRADALGRRCAAGSRHERPYRRGRIGAWSATATGARTSSATCCERPEFELAPLCERDESRRAEFSAALSGHRGRGRRSTRSLADPSIEAVIDRHPAAHALPARQGRARGRQARARREAARDRDAARASELIDIARRARA